MCYVIIYVIGMILTFVLTSIFLDDPEDRDTEYEFSCFPAALLWPIFLIYFMVTALTVVINELSHKIHDEFHK